MKEQVEIIRSKRKTLLMEISPDLRIIVRAPLRMKKSDIQEFIDKSGAWISKHLQIERERAERMSSLKPFTSEDIKALSDRAKAEIPPRAEALAKIIGVNYQKITVRCQKTKWGSCTSSGNLNFNCLMMLCPEDVIDYLIIHELCHLKHMNHSKRFWSTVAKYCPDYKKSEEWLDTNGEEIINRQRV